MKTKCVIAAVLTLFTGRLAIAADASLQSQAQLVIKSPDATVSGTFELPATPALLDSLVRSPMLLAHLWEAYDFTPRYKARPQGGGIHVDDPTGIAGEVYPVEDSPVRHVFYGTGALNHRLVPSFRGRLALVLTVSPKGGGSAARVDVYIRAESRFLGFLASTLFPLVRTRAQHRIEANMNDITSILKDVSTAPRQAAARLRKEDADALLRIAAPPPEPKPASAATKKPAAKPAAKQTTKTAKKT